MRNNISKKICMTAMGAACSLGMLFTSNSAHAGISEFEARSLTVDALVHAFPHRRHVVAHRRAPQKHVRAVSYRAGVKHGSKSVRSRTVVRSAIYHRAKAGVHKAAFKRASVRVHRKVVRKPVAHVIKARRTAVHHRRSARG